MPPRGMMNSSFPPLNRTESILNTVTFLSVTAPLLSWSCRRQASFGGEGGVYLFVLTWASSWMNTVPSSDAVANTRA